MLAVLVNGNRFAIHIIYVLQMLHVCVAITSQHKINLS